MNEENSNSVLVNIVKRVKTGLEITNGSRNIAFSLLNNIRFDIIEDINKLIASNKKGNIKDVKKIHQRIGRLKERYKAITSIYKVKLNQN